MAAAAAFCPFPSEEPVSYAEDGMKRGDRSGRPGGWTPSQA